MRMTPKSPMSVADVQSASERLIRTAKQTGSAEDMNFHLIGKFSALSPQWFKKDPPLVGDPSREIMCWVTSFADTSGSLEVKVWDKACRQYFEVSGADLRGLWENGAQDSSKQEEILEQLNSSADRQWRAECTLRIWSTGGREQKHRPQVHVKFH